VKVDFSKDNILPTISKSNAEKLGVEQLPVRLKKGIIDRQKISHSDVKEK
jgi:hypothetical protein